MPHSTRPAALRGLALALSLALSPALLAGEVGWIEEFALSVDRAKALEQLIPGTEEHYFFHALAAEHEGQLDRVDGLLKAWIERHGRTARVVEIENRQALLRYPAAPRASLDFLVSRLGLTFPHQREVLGEKPTLPTRLDPAVISRETLTRRALELHPGTTDGFEDRALEWLSAAQLDGSRRRHLLSRLALPDVPGLARLVVEDLSTKESRGFGSLGIHGKLVLSQLEECLKLKPELLGDGNFVKAWIVKLWPDADTDWRRDAKAREAYLDRLQAFVGKLSPVFVSLKAHVLYHRLVHDRSQGVWSRERFLEYVKLPRTTPYARKEWVEREQSRRSPFANLGEDLSGVTQLGAVGNDEGLVRSYLEKLFVEGVERSAYEEWVDPLWLKGVYAESRILAGVGDQEALYSLLAPERLQALRERVELEFAWTNRTVFGPGDRVQLDVWVKNVKTLIVKVFELNTLNYYRETARELDTAVDLDGLVANEERLVEYGEPALRRVSRRFEFPKLEGRGAWVVELVGGGIASRALVLKGRLSSLERLGAAGHVFTVMDEGSRKAEGASVWLGGKRYEAGADGRIVVPYSTSPGRRAVVLEAGGFASLATFEHRGEDYQLASGIHADREELLSGGKARLLVRPVLTLNGLPVSLKLLESPRLVLTSTDHEGVSSSKEVGELKLGEGEEYIHELAVPSGLGSLKVELRGRVEVLSQGKKVDVGAERTFVLNGIEKTEKIEDVHLGKAGGSYFLEVLGKNGEARADRPVQVQMKHRDFREAVDQTLQSDAVGRVELGTLEGIEWLRAAGPEGTGDTWALLGDWHDLPGHLHGAAGETLWVPWTGGAKEARRSDLTLLEVRGDTYLRDRFECLSVAEGYVRIAGLEAGDYDLVLKEQGHRIRIRLAAGETREGYAVSGYRRLERRAAKPLQIAGIEADKESVRIRLSGWSSAARVHVAATRYVPEWSMPGDLVAVTIPDPEAMLLPGVESLFVTGRDLGDEIRYILERKLARKFPGTLLARPSLLLNPWAIRTTETSTQEAQAGGEFLRKSADAAPRPARAGANRASEKDGQAAVPLGFSSLDFLGEPAAVLVNLVPDEKGVVTIARKALGAHAILQVIAIDPLSTAYRTTSLEEAERKFRDLRLAGALDPEKHFTERRQVTVVAKDAPFAVSDLATAELEVYDTLAKAYRLLVTLSGDATLQEFGFILGWPKLTDDQKRTEYEKHACHELNFFIHEKDPETFERVVKPYLANKLSKTFLDRWLLGEDLREYLEPRRFERLNVVEKILLARRIAAEKGPISRYVRDALDLLPPDLERQSHLFKTALRGQAMETADALGLKDAVAEIRAGLVPLEEAAAAEEEPAAAESKEVDKAAVRQLAAKDGRASRARRSAGAALADRADEKAKGVDTFTLAFNGAALGRDLALRGEVRQLFRKLERTQEWVESNWWRQPIESQEASLITENAFWGDFAEFGGDGPFLSRNLAEASRSFAEMMMALSVLDLPFEAGEHRSKIEGSRFELQAASPLVVYHEEIQPAEPVEGDGSILVTQRYYRHGERHVQVGNEQRDKFLDGELLTGAVYGCHVVVTNPTSGRQKLDVLLQVPRGSIPVSGGRQTRGVRVDLEPYRTWTVDYFFYFPRAGTWGHFPVHVAREEKLVAWGKPSVVTVVDTPTTVDTSSWDWISQNGTEEQVLGYLGKENLGRVNLERIAWRMKDRGFFEKTLELLRSRHVWQGTLWSYGFVHGDARSVREWLRHADEFVSQCGSALESELLAIDPVERKAWEQREYWPLVNARAHRLGRGRQILNDRMYEQYMRLLDILAHRARLDDEDLLTVTCYLLLQDRVEEALGYFARVRPGRVETALQYDYFQAWLGMSTEDLRTARAVSEKHRDEPVERWRNLFRGVLAQLDEIEGKGAAVVNPEDRDQAQGKLAATEPSVELELAGTTVRIRHRNVSEARVSFYLMDIELLFSRNPFVGEYAGQFSMIRPNATREVKLEGAGGVTEVELPEELREENVLVEVEGGGRKQAKTHFSGAMAVEVIESYAQVRVTEAKTGKALSKVYVKTYAKMQDGGVRFYKDGYTDLRGRFDYGSLSTNELDGVARFAILVLSETQGAVVKEADPPKR